MTAFANEQSHKSSSRAKSPVNGEDSGSTQCMCSAYIYLLWEAQSVLCIYIPAVGGTVSALHIYTCCGRHSQCSAYIYLLWEAQSVLCIYIPAVGGTVSALASSYPGLQELNYTTFQKCSLNQVLSGSMILWSILCFLCVNVCVFIQRNWSRSFFRWGTPGQPL